MITMLMMGECRQRNSRAFALGRWVIRPSNDKLARRGGVVCNYDEVYLEQVMTPPPVALG